MLKLLTAKFQALFVIAIIMSCYYPSVFVPFNSVDDEKMINYLLNFGNIPVKDIFFPNTSGQYYRPLLFLSFVVDSSVWGLDASFMHLENILLHLANTLLVFCLAKLILPSLSNEQSHPYAPLATALLFGLHPISTEPVNWVSGRTDLMAGFFMLLSFNFFLLAGKQISSTAPYFCIFGNRMKPIGYLLCPYVLGVFGAVSFLAGCLSKETALFVLPVILAWCVCPPGINYGSRHYASLPSLLVPLRVYFFTIYGTAGVVYLFLRWMALSGGDNIVKSVSNIAASSTNTGTFDLFDIARVTTKTAGFYFKKLIIPVPLNFGINSISSHYLWLGLLVFCGVIWCIYRHDIISYLFLAAFMLASSAFLLPILKITWTPIAERYVYMASAPFIIGMVALYIKYFKNVLSTRMVILVLATVLTGATVLTVQRNIIWQDNCTLFEDTLKKSPDFAAAKNELAIALRKNGKYEESNVLLLSNSNDDQRPSTLNKIRVYANNREFEKAYSMLLERSARGVPEDKDSLELRNVINNHRLESVSNDMIKVEINNEILTTTLKLHETTGDPFYSYRSGLVYLRLGRQKEAKQAFEKAWRESPLNSHYRKAAKQLAERILP